jgi:hypothetical protein
VTENYAGGRQAPEEKPPGSRNNAMNFDGPTLRRITGLLLRAIFIVILGVLTLRVSMPQNETIWTAYDTPGDLIRILLGLAVCVWLAIQLFNIRPDAADNRIWVYLGLVLIPLALICLDAIW